MNIKRLFFVNTRTENRRLVDGDTGGGGSQQAAFVTMQSLATFPVASGAVTIIWNLIKAIIDGQWAENKLVPLVVATVIGLFLTLWSMTESGLSTRVRIGIAFVGVINIAFLAAAAIGIDTTLDVGLAPANGS